MSLHRRLLAEFIGTAFLLMAVVGGGIAAQRLSPADVGLQLFEAAVVTAFALMALILMMAPVSGAHFNPAVTAADVLLGGRDWREGGAYVAAQLSGGIVGTILSNLMFELPAIATSQTERSGYGQLLGELIATVGLLLVIFVMVRTGSTSMIGVAVGAYIGGAYFFTSSTSFANPAVTIARIFTDTFAGISAASAPGFLLAQLAAVVVAVPLIRVITADGS